MFKRAVFGVRAAGIAQRVSLSARNPQAGVFSVQKAAFLPQIRYKSDKISEITTELSQFTDELPIASTMTSDQLGYLDSIGMAQGFGPTALIERFLEYTHVFSGLPWWGSIVVATLAVRVVMFPLYVKASANAAKMSKIKPQLDELMQQMKNADSPQEQVEASFERKKLLKAHDVHMSHQFFPVLQLPVAYGFFQGLRKMANHPVEGLSTQGYAWFGDLTQVDPYLGLQAISAAVVLGMFKMGGETGTAQMSPAFKNIMYVLPVVSIFVTKEFSAAVVLYFAVNSIFSFIQTMILRSSTVRKMLKLPKIEKPAALASSKPQPQSLGEWWKEWNAQAKEQASKKLQKTNTKLGNMERRRNDVNKNFIKRH